VSVFKISCTEVGVMKIGVFKISVCEDCTDGIGTGEDWGVEPADVEEIGMIEISVSEVCIFKPRAGESSILEIGT
jgi:hypothetical protein